MENESESPRSNNESETDDLMSNSETEESTELWAESKVSSAIDILDSIRDSIDPELFALLCEPNVVLTLVGARGQTETGFDFPTPKDELAIKQANELLNKYGIYLETHHDTAASTETPVLMIDVISLTGLQDASGRSKIPGIKPYDPETGLTGVTLWFNESLEAIKEQYHQGNIDQNIAEDDLGHIIVGVAKGYPDLAILSFMAILSQGESGYEQRSLTDIPYSREYPCAEPNYEYDQTYGNDPEIIAHQALWGKILKDFYTSKWHQTIKQDPEFIKAVDRVQERYERTKHSKK